MKFLVTGGSGFLGINLVRYLHSKGHEIKSLDLEDFDYPDVKDKIEIIKGDIRDKAQVEKAVEGVNIIVHSAAALPLYTPEEIFSTDIDGTRNMLEAAEKFKVDRSFEHVSCAVNIR